MNISEIFHSIQGEGRLVGVPSVFIRVSGCNLRCTWCDTPYASWNPEGEEMSPDLIARTIKRYRASHVVITGGEPMIFPEITELSALLGESGYHITIETAATIYHPVTCDLASISPKMANSTPFVRDSGREAARHEHLRLNRDVIQRFMDNFEHQLKFVVDAPGDLVEIEELVGSLSGVRPENVLLMPQGTTVEELRSKATWLADACMERSFRYCPRLQIELYGNTRGT